jgi:phosphatidylinositol-3-phosphatase
MAFADIASSPLCQQVVPLSQLRAADLPSFSFVTPNQCSDMHSCDVATGDQWLSRYVPALIDAGAIVIVTFDEGSSDEGGGGRIILLEIGPGIPAGARETASFDHYSLLVALEDRFDLPRLGAARTADPIPL